ncbi:bifunctional adenosylcobinamide kinase/adenosylcobinamide-phosphate guanylyltransferase [Nonomuraea endophytica]|uniref:Adenosylcobinamide kinase n=1 Tax=Nonomuraea endophytica TaxID=714136 RepID=A0A7W8AAF1_9ACTN|nr:bifunctional adenosylcobinamide kinase/adenosylcobinamide-phosphate guanylyltransferase [Nonomuraea endophytica]MBB5082530.1 adenosylcobinamide kinase/adenosylcobinamide-phosphate guanylyltransferase [Nonomuraea endophytica]
MKIVLSGTAGPRGRPEPGCPCASCLTLPGGHRRPTEVLVDGQAISPGSHVLVDGQVLPPGSHVRGGVRLLFEPDAALPDDGAGGPYDVVLLDLLGRPERLGELRRAGMVAAGAQVVAVGLDHRVRSEEELGRRLELWGARAVPDGTVLELPGPARVPHPRRTLLLGGSRSGKSAEAELRLAAEPHVTYVATGPSGAGDGEWAARVRAHRERRPAHWDTAETTDLAGTIATATTPLLVDGLGTWVAAVFDEHGAWEGPREPVWRRCDELVEAWRRTPVEIVAVSDEVGLGVVPATASGRAFRDVLGKLNERLAAESEYVALVVAGRLLPL